MRPVIVGFSGAEAITTRSQLDVQIDRDEALLKRTTTPGDVILLESQLALMRLIRDKFDAALANRDQDIPVPF